MYACYIMYIIHCSVYTKYALYYDYGNLNALSLITACMQLRQGINK